MRGQQEQTGPLFSYVYTEDRIPKGHPLRQVWQLADQELDRLIPTLQALSRGRHARAVANFKQQNLVCLLSGERLEPSHVFLD
jgi:hypothetical protein